MTERVAPHQIFIDGEEEKEIDQHLGLSNALQGYWGCVTDHTMYVSSRK